MLQEYLRFECPSDASSRAPQYLSGLTTFLQKINNGATGTSKYENTSNYVEDLTGFLWDKCIENMEGTPSFDEGKENEMFVFKFPFDNIEYTNDLLFRITIFSALLFYTEKDDKRIKFELATDCRSNSSNKFTLESDGLLTLNDENGNPLNTLIDELLEKLRKKFETVRKTNFFLGASQCVVLKIRSANANGNLFTVWRGTFFSDDKKARLIFPAEIQNLKKIQNCMKNIVSFHNATISNVTRMTKCDNFLQSYREVCQEMLGGNMLSAFKSLQEQREEDLYQHMNNHEWLKNNGIETFDNGFKKDEKAYKDFKQMVIDTFFVRCLDAELNYLQNVPDLWELPKDIGLAQNEKTWKEFCKKFIKYIRDYRTSFPLLSMLFEGNSKLNGDLLAGQTQLSDQSLKQCFADLLKDNHYTKQRLKVYTEIRYLDPKKGFFLGTLTNSLNAYVAQGDKQISFLIVYNPKAEYVGGNSQIKKRSFYKKFYQIAGLAEVLKNRFESIQQIAENIAKLQDYQKFIKNISTVTLNEQTIRDHLPDIVSLTSMNAPESLSKLSGTQVYDESTWNFEEHRGKMNKNVDVSRTLKIGDSFYAALARTGSDLCNEFNDCLFLNENNPANFNQFIQQQDGTYINSGYPVLSMYNTENRKRFSLSKYLAQLLKNRKDKYLFEFSTFENILKSIKTLDFKAGLETDIFSITRNFVIDKTGDSKTKKIVYQFNVPRSTINLADNKWFVEFIAFTVMLWQPTIIGDRICKDCVQLNTRKTGLFLNNFLKVKLEEAKPENDLMDLIEEATKKNKRLKTNGQNSTQGKPNTDTEIDDTVFITGNVEKLAFMSNNDDSDEALASLGTAFDTLRLKLKKQKV